MCSVSPSLEMTGPLLFPSAEREQEAAAAGRGAGEQAERSHQEDREAGAATERRAARTQPDAHQGQQPGDRPAAAAAKFCSTRRRHLTDLVHDPRKTQSTPTISFSGTSTDCYSCFHAESEQQRRASNEFSTKITARVLLLMFFSFMFIFFSLLVLLDTSIMMLTLTRKMM